MDKRKIEVMLWIVIFLSIVPVLIFSYEGIRNINIYIHRQDYRIGTFIVDSRNCGDGYGGSHFNCYGYGKINNKIKTKVNMGKNPSTTSLFGEYADLNKYIYLVFYRENGKQTLLIRDESQIVFNAIPYLKRGILELLYPIIIFPIIIYLYKKVKKQNIEQNIWQKK